MRIRVLGCSGGVGPDLRTTSLLVDDRLLVDAGTGVCDLDLDAMARLTDVFLTHSHLDHVVGTAFIADNRFARKAPTLAIRATPETIDALRTHLFNWVLWPDFTELLCRHESPVLRYEALSPGVPVAVNGLQITAFRVLHTVPAVGYVLSDASGCFAFSGDTCADDGMWVALNALPRLDRLMIEISYADEDETLACLSKHLSPARLGTELKKLNHRPELLLSHPKPGQAQAIEAQCHAALAGWHYRHLKDGDVITCG